MAAAVANPSTFGSSILQNHDLKGLQQDLELSQTGLDAKGLCQVIESLPKSIKTISLAGNRIDNSGVSLLMLALSSSSAIERIDLSKNRIGNDGAREIARLLPNTKLDHIYLSDNPVTFEAIAILCEAARDNSLRQLRLDVHDQGTGELLLDLDLYNYCYKYFRVRMTCGKLSQQNAQSIAGVFQIATELVGPSAIELKLVKPANSCLDKDCLENLALALSGLQLGALELDSDLLEESDKTHLVVEALAKGFRSIQSLQLHCNSTRCAQSDSVVKGLGELLEKVKVSELDLSGSGLGDKGLEHLAPVIRRGGLTSLKLSENCIGDEGLRFLGESLRESHLRTIDLTHNFIGDVGVQNLASGISPKSSIDLIDLRYNRVSAEGFQCLDRAFHSMATN